MKKSNKAIPLPPTDLDNPVVELEPISDEELATINGGRYYGWNAGGWDTSAPRPSGFLDWSQNH